MKAKSKEKRRSPLEIEIEALLAALGVAYEREVSINGITVDFVINGEKILEVEGAHHFTVDGKHKGRDLVRRTVLEQWLPVKLINFQEINSSLGIQNKLQLLASNLGTGP